MGIETALLFWLFSTMLPPKVEIPYEIRLRIYEMKYWQHYLSQEERLMCHARVGTRDGDGTYPAETAEQIEARVQVPLWVLEEVNRGYDLDMLEIEQLFWIPAHETWTVQFRQCVDPVRLVYVGARNAAGASCSSAIT
jgi:hypothetical protein